MQHWGMQHWGMQHWGMQHWGMQHWVQFASGTKKYCCLNRKVSSNQYK